MRRRDLHAGPLVIEVPEGPLLGAVLDINQRWIADMGLPGPDAGKGGKHLLLPPGYSATIPDGYFAAEATSWRVIAGMRALPTEGDVRGAVERLQTIKVYPLDPAAPWTAPTWYDQTPMPQNQTPTEWEDTLASGRRCRRSWTPSRRSPTRSATTAILPPLASPKASRSAPTSA